MRLNPPAMRSGGTVMAGHRAPIFYTARNQVRRQVTRSKVAIYTAPHLALQHSAKR